MTRLPTHLLLVCVAAACRATEDQGAPKVIAAPTAGSAAVPAPPLRQVQLTVHGLPLGNYTLTVVQEQGREVRLPGTASGEFTLELAPGPSSAHIELDTRRFEWVFSVGEAAAQQFVWHVH
jgi:hypothetical protein